jgi:hypothetical protein
VRHLRHSFCLRRRISLISVIMIMSLMQ